MQGIEPIRLSSRGVRQPLRVDPERDRGIPVAELLSHVGDRGARLQEQARVGVSEIVDADLPQLGLRRR